MNGLAKTTWRLARSVFVVSNSMLFAKQKKV